MFYKLKVSSLSLVCDVKVFFYKHYSNTVVLAEIKIKNIGEFRLTTVPRKVLTLRGIIQERSVTCHCSYICTAVNLLKIVKRSTNWRYMKVMKQSPRWIWLKEKTTDKISRHCLLKNASFSPKHDCFISVLISIK